MVTGMVKAPVLQIILAGLLILAFGLSSCSGSPTATAPTSQPSFTPRPTLTPTPPATAAPTFTPTVTHTPLPPPTATLPPLPPGMGLPAQREPIVEGNLGSLRELARWGNGTVEGVAWSPDSTRVAAATTQGLYLYDSESLQRQAFMQTSAPASHPIFSPDSTFVAAAITLPGQLGASAVLVWSVSGARLIKTLPAPGKVLALAYSTDGSSLRALTRLDRGGASLVIWDAASGDTLRILDLIGGENAESAAFSPDGSLAVTRGANGPVRLWQLSDGKNYATTQESGQHAGPMAFSPDGKSLAIGYIDTTRDYRNQNEIRVWYVPAPEEIKPAYLLYALSDSVRARGPALAEGMQQTLLSLAWSADGSMIAAGYEDRTVRVWQAAPSEPLRRMAASTLPSALVFSPTGDRVAVGGLEIFKVSDATLISYTNDFLPGLNDMALSPSGNFVALAGYGLIQVRRVEDGTVAYTITGMDGPVNAVDISSDGFYLVAACQDGTTRLYRLSDGLYLASLGIPTYPVLSAAFSANGRWIASGNENMLVQIFRLDDGQLMLGLKEPYVSYKLLFSPNVDQLASLTTSGVWLRGFSGEIQKVETELQGMAGGVSLSDMVYSRGEEHLALVGNGVIRVINPATRQDRYIISTTSSQLPESVLPWSVAFSPDNAFLSVGWSDGSVRMYWASDGSSLAARLAHPAAVLRVAFTRDARLMVTLGEEGTIRLWGVSSP